MQILQDQRRVYRNENCQYLHNIGINEKSTYSQESDDAQEKTVSFKCDYCSCISTNKITLNKHIHTKHGDKCCHEKVSTFICRLGLEELAQEYKD